MNWPRTGSGLPREEIDRLADQARHASGMLKAMSHETRLLILCILSRGEKSVSDLEAILAQPQAAVSQQLARLRSDGLVKTRRKGRMIYYSLAAGKVDALMGTLKTLFDNNGTGGE